MGTQGLGSPVGSPGRRGWHWGAGRCHCFLGQPLARCQNSSPASSAALRGAILLLRASVCCPTKAGPAGVVPQMCRPPRAPTRHRQERPATFLLHLFSRWGGDELGSVCSQGREEPFLEIPNLSSLRQTSGLETERKWGRLGSKEERWLVQPAFCHSDPAPAPP